MMDEEAEGITGIPITGVEAARSAGARLLDQGVGAACLKLSDGGCVTVDGQAASHVAPLSIDVVDAAGAGDAFAGALAVALLEKRPLLNAAYLAVAASHLAVTGYGLQPACPTRDELGGVFEELRARVQMLRPRS